MFKSEGIYRTPPANKAKVQGPRPHSQKNKVELRSTLKLKNTSLGIRRTNAVLRSNLGASAHLMVAYRSG